MLKKVSHTRVIKLHANLRFRGWHRRKDIKKRVKFTRAFAELYYQERDDTKRRHLFFYFRHKIFFSIRIAFYKNFCLVSNLSFAIDSAIKFDHMKK